MSPIICAENLTHVYSAGTPFEVTALEGISLEIKRGEFFAIVGATGSGKSTLIQHFNGLMAPTSGKLRVCGVDVSGKRARRDLWRRVGLVFQHPEQQLFEETVFDDVAFGPKNMGLSGNEVRQRVIEALRLVGLDPEQAERQSPFQLSGGNMRRAAIAGVLALKPEVLVLDEPTAGLDPRGRRQLLDLVESFRQKEGSTVVLVTHNMEEVAARAERIAVLHKGRLAMLGTPREVFNRAEELRAMGLDISVAAALMRQLREAGLPVRTDILTSKEAEEEIARAMTGKPGESYAPGHRPHS
ncbi:MAG: energy-coupling factor transporter ATPase [Peptococcaceae bacterium]|jgi:energy-coupling factor transport system ATP-binding protein|nr:energy-coupling factor transporter ATPase [Peptococcaceae bacterium]